MKNARPEMKSSLYVLESRMEVIVNELEDRSTEIVQLKKKRLKMSRALGTSFKISKVYQNTCSWSLRKDARNWSRKKCFNK